MEASNPEASIPQEQISTPLLRKQVYNINGIDVEVGVAEFKQEAVKTNINAVVYLMGWPWTAKDETTWAFPAQLAEKLKTPCFSIDTAKAKEALALQGEAIGQFLTKEGVRNVTIVGHSLGSLKAAYTVHALQHSGVEINALFLADPIGLDKRWTLGLLKDLARDVGTVAPKERKKGGVKAGEKGPLIEAVPPA